MEYEIIVEPNRYMPQVVQHTITLGMNYIGAVSATFTRTSTTAAGGGDSEGAAVEAAALEEPGCEVNVDFKLVVSYDVDHVYVWHPIEHPTTPGLTRCTPYHACVCAGTICIKPRGIPSTLFTTGQSPKWASTARATRLPWLPPTPLRVKPRRRRPMVRRACSCATTCGTATRHHGCGTSRACGGICTPSEWTTWQRSSVGKRQTWLGYRR